MSEVENKVKITQNFINEDVGVKKPSDYHYIGVMFESKYDSTLTNPKFYDKIYEYKTKNNYREGEVIKINTQYGISRVVIVKENINESDLEFKEIDKIKEI